MSPDCPIIRGACMVARKSTKRKPARPKSRAPAKKRSPKAKVRRDPYKEHLEASKKWGLGEILQLSNDEAVCNIPGRLSTGCFALNKVLSNPGEPDGWAGVPMSRITEIYGPSYIGKSTLLDQMAAETIRAGGVVCLMDTENSRDRYYVETILRRVGIEDTDRYHLVHFDSTDTHLENVLRRAVHELQWLRSEFPELPMLIAWDALAGTATEDEVEKGVASDKNSQPGAAAKAMAQAGRLVTQELKGTRAAFVIANHEYENIGSGPFAGPKRKTYGGEALRHMASVRIQLYNAGKWIKSSEGVVYGREVVAKLIKNRLGPAPVEATIPMMTGFGTDNIYTIYKDLRSAKYIVSSGSWSSINVDGEVFNFQGWLGLRNKCAEDPEFYARLVGAWKEVML